MSARCFQHIVQSYAITVSSYIDRQVMLALLQRTIETSVSTCTQDAFIMFA